MQILWLYSGNLPQAWNISANLCFKVHTFSHVRTEIGNHTWRWISIILKTLLWSPGSIIGQYIKFKDQACQELIHPYSLRQIGNQWLSHYETFPRHVFISLILSHSDLICLHKTIKQRFWHHNERAIIVISFEIKCLLLINCFISYY